MNLDIAHLRLVNQQIVQPTLQTPQEVVGWLCAVQAQDYSGAKWSLGLRLPGVTDLDVEQSFTDGSILRTHLLRPTWHFVTPADIRWLLALTAPRVLLKSAYMHRKLDLNTEIFNRSNAAIGKALQGGHQFTRDELFARLKNSGIPIDKNLQMVYFLMFAELDGLICSGPRRGKQFTYALLEERVPDVKPMTKDNALAVLAGRYFNSRGPATVQDFAKWSGLTLTDARHGLEAVSSQLNKEVIDGQTYWLPPSTPYEKNASPTASLLSIFDEYISGYTDHNVYQSTEIGARLRAMGNDLTYIIVIDGQIVGSWKRIIGKETVTIKTNLLTRLTAAEDEALSIAVQRYGDFLQLKTVFQPGDPGKA